LSISNGTKSNPNVQRTEASRLAHSQFVAQWRLAPAADADRQARASKEKKLSATENASFPFSHFRVGTPTWFSDRPVGILIESLEV